MKTWKAGLIEVPQFLAWLLLGQEKNHVDLGVLDYPTLRLYGAGGEKTAGYLPLHTGVILESLAFNPEASAEDKLEAACAMVTAVEAEAKDAGVREMYFMSSDPRTDEAAAKHLGFTEVKCYRKRIGGK